MRDSRRGCGASGWEAWVRLRGHTFNDGDACVGRQHTSQPESATLEQLSKLGFGALASAGQNKHFEIENSSEAGLVRGANHSVNHQHLAVLGAGKRGACVAQ